MPHLISPPDHRALSKLPPATAQQVLIIAGAATASPELIAELRARLQRGAVRFHLVVPRSEQPPSPLVLRHQPGCAHRTAGR